MTADLFDAGALGVPVTDAALAKHRQAPTRARLPRPLPGEQYLGGPIPMSWLRVAAALPGKAFHLAVALWFEAGRRRGKSPTAHLSAATYRSFGLASRNTRDRALEALAGAGLVRVETRTGRPVLITIVASGPDPDGPAAGS
jgi:hypothetical protein